jgi:hypothetical protein
MYMTLLCKGLYYVADFSYVYYFNYVYYFSYIYDFII